VADQALQQRRMAATRRPWPAGSPRWHRRYRRTRAGGGREKVGARAGWFGFVGPEVKRRPAGAPVPFSFLKKILFSIVFKLSFDQFKNIFKVFTKNKSCSQ
jgi:hypothetical protein